MLLQHVNFDVLVLIILIGMVMIGYISGATVEIIKLIKIYVPFIVVFYLGGPISRMVYKSELFNDIVNNIKFLQGIVYFNTIVMFLSTIIAFVGSYFILGLIIKFIQKRLQSEIVTYKLGKFNHQLGAIIAIARFYVIISILLLPFFMLNLTSKNDLFTNLVLESPPPYTQIGRLVNASEPVAEASNSLTDFMNFINIEKLKEEYETINNLPSTLQSYDEQVQQTACYYTPGTGKYGYLSAYLNDPETCDNESLQEILPYKGLILWANTVNEDVLNNHDFLITSFKANFSQIMDNTDDEEMKIKLNKAYDFISVYQVIDDWLVDKLSGKYDLSTLLNDENIQIIIYELNKDSGTRSNEGLFYELKQLNNLEIDKRLVSLETFLTNYNQTYEDAMKTLPDELPFKYRLIASTLKEKFDFMPSLERTPLIAMYVIDTLDLMNKNNMQIMNDEPLNLSFVKIVFPLYVLKQDDDGHLQMFTKTDMEAFLTKECSDVCSIDEAFDNVIITRDFFLDLVKAFVDDTSGESYLEYLYQNQLINKEAIEVLKQYVINQYSSEDVQAIVDAMDKVGGANG